jgi:hypothetical protein
MNLSGNLGPSPRSLEVEDLESFDRMLAAGAVHLQGWHAQSLDLRGRASALAGLDVEGASAHLSTTHGSPLQPVPLHALLARRTL